MDAQEFCLRWNNHQTNFISVFSNLLSSESLVDVTLAAEGKHVQAHKVVLSACSSYFQNLFTANPCQHPIVILKDVKYTDLKTMIDFMYCGEVNLSIEQLPAILKTAETLMVKGLAENPDQYISYEAVENKISTESCRLTPSRLMHKRLRKSSLDSGSGSTEQSTGVNEKNGDWAVYIEPIMPDNYCRRPRRSRRIKMQQREASSKAFEPVRTEPFGFLDSDESHSPPRLKNKKLRKSSADPGCSYTEQTTNFSQEMVANPQQSASQCSQKSENHPPQNKSSTLSDDKSGPDRSSINEASTGPSTTLQTHLSSGESAVHMGPCTRLRQPKTTSQCFNRKRRRIKPQQKAAFRKALEAVKTNRLSVCKAAKVYGVSHRTLRIEYIRLGYSSVNSHLKIGADLLSTAQSTQKSTKESLSMAHSTLESTSVNSSRGVGQDQMPPPTPSPPPSHCSKPNTTPLVVDLNRSNLITELAC